MTNCNCISDKDNGHQAIQRGDIVAFHFPSGKSGKPAQFFPHPWLVLDMQTHVGQLYLTLARWHEAGQLPHRFYELVVSQSGQATIAGVSGPMLFNCRQQVIVSVRHKGFALGQHGFPVIGMVNESELERLNAIRARLQAFADIRAEERTCRQRKPPSTHSPSKRIPQQELNSPAAPDQP
nr:hypothetical protein [uncultured Cohaesibacter sp.]